VRTTTYYDKKQMKEKKLPRSHVIKKRLLNENFKAHGTPFDVRVSLSSETDMSVQHLPATVRPTFVRAKLRKRFVKNHWSFEFTKVWEATNGVDVDQVCLTKPPKFEIELELIRPRELLREGEQSAKNRLVAASMLTKVVALLGGADVFL